ncbi:hypothetical protein [Thermoflavifilum thermophilum]|nr:hypothetical protein [Thermoflavifilum thermophilum]
MAYSVRSATTVVLVRYYPRTVHQNMHVIFRSESFVHVRMEIKDYNMRIWSGRTLLLRPGEQELIFHLHFLAEGMYWIEWDKPELPWIEFLKA